MSELTDKLEAQGVPAEMVEFIGEVGLLGIDADTPEAALYRAQLEGKCATCQGVVGREAMFLVQGGVVCGIFCGGQCMVDMQLIGWMQEQHDDIVQAIQFRGNNRGDQPEEE